MHAKIKYLAATGSTGNYTQNKEYDVLGFTASAGSVYAVVVDDSGTALGAVQVDGNTWETSEAYVTERIV